METVRITAPPHIPEAPLEFALIVLTVTQVSEWRRNRSGQASTATGCETDRC